jgi:hypothetical protein
MQRGGDRPLLSGPTPMTVNARGLSKLAQCLFAAVVLWLVVSAPTITLANGTVEDDGRPSVVVDGQGNAYFAWT